MPWSPLPNLGLNRKGIEMADNTDDATGDAPKPETPKPTDPTTVALINAEFGGELSPGADMHYSGALDGTFVTAETGARIMNCLRLLANRIDQLEERLPAPKP